MHKRLNWFLVIASLAGCATGDIERTEHADGTADAAVAAGAICARDGAMSEPASAQEREEDAVREVVQWYYDAFSSKSFEGADEFMTEDFDNINPGGGWTRSREAVLSEYASLLSSLLADVTFTHDDTSIWFAADDVAFAATTAHLTAYVAFDGTKHGNDSNRVSLVLVKRGGRWRLVHVQNTPV